MQEGAIILIKYWLEHAEKEGGIRNLGKSKSFVCSGVEGIYEADSLRI